MPAVRTWTTTLACAVALATSACGGAGTQSAGSGGQTGGPAEGGSPPPEEVTFSAADLCDLVLTEQDVPSGMSVFDERDKPDECGVLFGTDGEFPSVLSAAYLYDDAAEAETELDAFRDEALRDEGVREIEAPLGDEGFGVFEQGVSTQTEASQGRVLYYWRVGNVVLHVAYTASFGEKVEEGDALPLAEVIQSRAEEL
jgi:hypothetical protein